MFSIPSLSDHYFRVKIEVFFLYQSQFCSVNIFLILSRKNVSKLLETPMLWFRGGYIGKFFEFSIFLKSFDTNLAENDPQWQIWPKKWLRLSQNGQFGMFFYVLPQNEAEIDSEWSISADSQLFPSFATKVSHFWRNLKNFRFGGGTFTNFLSFPTFSNRFRRM